MAMDADERELFEATLRGVVDQHAGDGRGLDAALDDMGWPDALAADPRVAVSVLFERQGEANATSSALDSVVRHALGLGADPSGRVALPPLGTWHPPGVLAEGGLSVQGLVVPAPAPDPGPLLVVADAGAGTSALVVDAADLSARPVQGLDPGLGVALVSGAAAPGAAGPGRPRTLAHDAWAHAVDHARLAVGHELVGAATRMLELARAHAVDRVQFGRPIAGFQAVRHRLAETLVAVEGARALLDAAWEAPSAEAAAMAKATAGRSARTAARHCQQVLAGVGFTTEHPLHRYVRRVLVLDELFGSSRVLTSALGEDLLAGAPLPAPIPL